MIAVFRQLPPYLIPYRWRYAAGFAALALKSAFAAAIPVVLKLAIDRLAAGGAVSNVTALAGWLLALAALKAIAQYGMRRILIGLSRDVEYDLSNVIFRRLMAQPQRFYRTYRTGDLMSRAVNDLAAVRQMLGPGVMYSADAVLTFAVVLTVMSIVDWRLTVLVFVPVPLVSLTVTHFGRKTHDAFQKVQERLSAITSMVQENLSNMRIVRAYAQNDAEERRFKSLNEAYLGDNLVLVRLWSKFYPRMELFIGLTYAAVLGFGGWRVIEGAISLGSFVMFLSYLALLAWPMISFGWVVNLVQRGTASLERIQEILRYPPQIEDGPQTDFSIAGLRGDLAFRNVSVRYPGADSFALEGIDLEVRTGQTLVIAGPVGSGKTTLLSLVPRLLDPAAGAVIVDRMDVRRIPLETLRRSVGFVPQEPFLFSRTIRENLRTGAPEAEDWQIAEAADIAQIWDEIAGFPQGLDTLVGERGVTLSGGQKQRIALARALLCDPRILILDDALSMVDAATEAAILEGLRRFMRNRTTLAVSHRIQAARLADRIAVLERGRIVEYGSHQQLLDLGERYASLCRKQTLEEELVSDD